MGPLSLQNELTCIEVLSRACQSALALFPQSLAEDQQWLNESQKSQIDLSKSLESHNNFADVMLMRNIVIQRAGEKEVLTYWLEFAGEMKRLAALPLTQLDQLVKRSESHASAKDAGRETDLRACSAGAASSWNTEHDAWTQHKDGMIELIDQRYLGFVKSTLKGLIAKAEAIQ